jgi:hypothetical protein
MKQFNMFSKEENGFEENKTYTSKIEAPIYEPKNKKPELLQLLDRSKTQRLIKKINESNITDEEKFFLKFAAQRHLVFNYELIADYYAHSNKEMQELMEDSALVIIDFEKAIKLGFVKLTEQIKRQYLEEYGE